MTDSICFDMKVGIIASLGLISVLSAQEGAKIYQTYCVACHGAQGEGRKGAAPALSQSSWVNGDPKIITKVLLHGVQGKMSMHGEDFELYMPAQTLLNDRKIADVASYVRSHWGNKAPAISEEFVQETRAQTKSQNGVINSMHFVRPFDLKDYTFKIGNLLSASFPFTTNFDALKDEVPQAIEEEQGGLISPSQVGAVEDSFTARWRGLLKIEKPGEYHFSYGTDHAARISIDGKAILDRAKGTAPSVGSIQLGKGVVEIEIYYAHEGNDSIFHRLFLSGPGINTYRLHSAAKKKRAPSIAINPNGKRPLVHRNFLEQGGERMLAVGFPEKVNFYFSTDHMRLSKVWKGEFLSVGDTWDGRAKGKITTPLGEPLLVTGKGQVFQSAEQQFQGYRFDENDQLSFAYRIGGFSFQENFSAAQGGYSLTRQIKMEPIVNAVKPLQWKLLENVVANDDSEFTTKEGLKLKITSANKARLSDGDLVLPVTQATTISLEYVWE